MTAEDFKDRVAQLMGDRDDEWCASKDFRTNSQYMNGWRYAVLIGADCIAINTDANRVLAKLCEWLIEHQPQPSPWDGVVLEGVGT